MTTKAIKPANGKVKLADREMVKMLMHSISIQSRLVHKIERAVKTGHGVRAVPVIHRLESLGVRYATMSRFNAIALGQIFLLFEENWDEMPKRFRQAYADCYSYFQEHYGYGDQMADMYATVWKAIYSGRYLRLDQVPHYVRLSQIAIAKQRVAAGYIIDGEMTAYRWKLLADETLSPKELRHKMAKGLDRPKVGRPPDTSQVVLIKETNDVRLYRKGKVLDLGHLNYTSPDPEVRQAVLLIVKRSHMQLRR